MTDVDVEAIAILGFGNARIPKSNHCVRVFLRHNMKEASRRFSERKSFSFNNHVCVHRLSVG